jgi:hypothetical protein
MYNGPDGFRKIFNESILNYETHGHYLDNFHDKKNNPMLYSFCLNNGKIDELSLRYAKNVNEELCLKFTNQKKKGLTGYKGIESQYEEIDDLDSKHILMLTLLFDNNIDFKNIVEIGGGCGNCIRLSQDIIYYDNWKIIDIPHMLDLQRYFLKNEIGDISKIEFIDGTKNNYNFSKNEIDLVFATHSLSELDWTTFINYMENIVIHSKYLFLGYNKKCPSPELIINKLKYIQNSHFIKVNNFDYIEKTGANVSYTLFKNTLLV